jgi:prepilin-type N-terminal cleavage/methylation domain-containing protein
MLKQKGFTLVEITLVIVLISILIAITTPLLSSVVIRNDLISAHESLYNALLRAQQLSRTQYKDSQWRVCIDNEAKEYTITAGTCTSTLYPEVIKINSGITVSSDQTLDIPFKLINGEIDYNNDFIKIDFTGGGISKSILINKSGVIDKEYNTET